MLSPIMKLYKLSPDLREFSSDQSYISLNLAKHAISSEAKQKNFVFSPLSIHVVLGLIAAGSTGRTREEILGYFKSESSDEFNTSLSRLAMILFADGPRLTCANGVWVDQRFTLKPKFKEIADNVYKVGTEQVDFLNQAEEERKKLNLWAAEKTNGLIKEVLSPGSIDSLTRLVFGNALYFKGAWEVKFDELSTTDYNFFLLNGNSIKAPFMTNSKWQYGSAFDDFKVLRLPYKQGEDTRRFSMYIFLPNSRDGLTSLVETVTAEPGFIERHLPHKQVRLDAFRIPKFKISFDFDASKVLKELGLVSAFTGGLTEMVEENQENLSVSTILHKAFINVNEEGTEAAAVTFGRVPPGASPCVMAKRMEFVADHPFLFVIREDNTGMLLFIGHILNPVE